MLYQSKHQLFGCSWDDSEAAAGSLLTINLAEHVLAHEFCMVHGQHIYSLLEKDAKSNIVYPGDCIDVDLFFSHRVLLQAWSVSSVEKL